MKKLSNGIIVIIVLCALVVVATVSYYFLTMPSANQTNNIVSVSIVYDQSCVLCPSANAVVDLLARNDINLSAPSSYNYNSTEAAELIRKYGLVQAPAIILTENIIDYPYAYQLFSQIDLPKANGSYILYLNPPFRNLSTNRMLGLVNTVYITDSSCADCYDVTVHKQILVDNYRVAIYNQTYAGVTSDIGKELIRKYNITAIPTFIMSPDAIFYPNLMEVWKDVGSVESDGYYVFRNVSQLGLPYKDLITGKLVNGTA
jgi:hypothetical protein